MISYANVTLPIPTPEVEDYVEQALSLRDVILFPEHVGGVDSIQWDKTGYHLDSRIILNNLKWPVGACNFGMFHAFVDEDSLDKIRRVLRPTPAPKRLVLDGLTIEGMTMLTPRPISFRDKPNGTPGLYVVSFVDDRYWWWMRTGTLAAQSTWAALFSGLATLLGVTLTTDTIAAAYLNPPADFFSKNHVLPPLLDAAANSVGQRVVFNFDGTVELQGPTTALNSAMRNAGFAVRAGGVMENADVRPSLPGIKVSFPKSELGVLSRTAEHTLTATFGLSQQFRGGTTTNYKTIKSTAVAYVTSGTPDNNTELQTLANKIGDDYWRWQLGGFDMSMAGVYEWNLDGMHDYSVLMRDGQVMTRVRAVQFEPGRMGHSSPTKYDVAYAWDGDMVGRSLLNLGHTLTPPGETTATTTLVTSNQTMLRITTAGTIHGLDNPIDGKRVRLWNVTSGDITLKHLGGSASTTNQIITSSGVDFTVGGGSFVDLDYHADDSKWRAMQSSVAGATSFTSITATTVISSIVNSTTINATTIITTIINGNSTTWTTGNIYNLDVIDNLYASGNAYMMIQNSLVDWFPYLYATLDGSYGDGSYYGAQVEPDVHPAWWVPGALDFDMLKEMNQNANVPTGVEVVIFAGDLLSNTINVTVTRAGGGTTTAEQTLTYRAASGTFKLAFAGETTANIAIGAAEASVKSAIEALTAVTDTVTVTKGGRNYEIVFNNSATTFYDTPMVPYFVGTPIESREFYFHWFTAGGGGPFAYVDYLNQSPIPECPGNNVARLFWVATAVNDGVWEYLTGTEGVNCQAFYLQGANSYLTPVFNPGAFFIWDGTQLIPFDGPTVDGQVLTADSGAPGGISWQ